ncbi:MAG TPA: SagB/ThcOx family dehydrogenase [Myxococcales bacterium]|nr:SagB/ThcOx family dehydrogenase [Myxococcales bacterium]
MPNALVAGMSAFAIAILLVAAGEPAVKLPAPRADGTVSVEAALRQRRSVRKFAAGSLGIAEVGQLCWAAQGVTDDQGHRTAPSARALYPLRLYVLAGDVSGLEPGLYRYLPAGHALQLVARGDRRADFDAKAVSQRWTTIAAAPAVFVIAGDGAGSGAAFGDRGRPFLWAEAGLAAQGFFLQATALGLGSVFVGGFQPAPAREVLGLPAGEEVLAVLPVGRRP